MLLDGMALAYRAYYAFIQRPLINAKGQNTSAVFGVVTFLNKILQDEKPDHIAVVFDTSAPTFRHDAYTEYKATRQKMPDDLSSQIPIIKQAIRAYNIPTVEREGFEADDIIGTLARQAEREGTRTFLVTSDKDLMQLVSDRITMYRPGRQGTDVDLVGIEQVREKFGVSPDKVVEVLALTGDTSDNVPGVPGVGEKTAIPLVQKFGSVDEIYRHLDDIPQKGLRTKLEANRELAFLSKDLVTIRTDVPIEISYHDLRAKEPDTEALAALFEELEFRSLLTRLRNPGASAPKPAPPEPAAAAPVEFGPLSDIRQDQHSYHIITTEKEFRSLCKRMKSAGRFVFDTETTSTDALHADLLGVSICIEAREAHYIPILPPPRDGGTGLFGDDAAPQPDADGMTPVRFADIAGALFLDESIVKIGHNLKYDMLVLSRYGIEVRGPLVDTMLASYLLRADGKHGLDAVAAEYLDYRMISYEDLTGTGKEQKALRDVPVAAVAEYSCEDADWTMRLADRFAGLLTAQEMSRLAQDVEYPLVGVLASMERTGVAIDVGFLRTMSAELSTQLDALTRSIYEQAGEPFNINSTQQLSEVLFNRLHLTPVRKTKTGFSTDVAVLESLRSEHPIIGTLLEYRQLTKLKSTYVDALPALVDPKTGRVHTSFNQTVAATGRLSSSDPNLQNIPIRTEIGRSIRRAFIPGRPGARILSADYSQIELRVMAHVSGDEGLAEAFRNREDIHATTAAKVFGVPIAEVSRDMRRKAKEVNFGIMYGIGAFGLASRLEISQTEARDIIARYFERFPGVQQYIHDTIESARRVGYVSTLLGRRRYIAEIRNANQTVRQNAERQAINMPIQGTAADMIKVAMVRLDRRIREHGLQSRLILQVHDELVCEVPEREESEMRTLVQGCMSEALTLCVPVEVDVGVGANWLEAH